ncbi:MAG TPA: hypothetical protein VFI13_14315, partial [Gemmatimonadales bacterium]|nr:hypothetical protein [Gemmatimonadales bacterium]
GLALTVSLDSVHVSGPNARTLEDSARGSVIRGRLSPTGRLDSLTSSADNGVDRTFLAALPWLVPNYPPSTAEGASVTDTLDATVPLGVLDVTERTVRQVRLGTTVGALELWGDLTRQGTGPQLELTGSGIRTAHADVDAAGRVLRLSGRDSVAMLAVASGTGQSVQLLQIETYTLTALP